jgi:5'-3' exoribonuclease 1
VDQHLRYFIRKKMKEDPLWKRLTIIYSGHSVPGEGEHKIMQFIRDMKASPEYQPNIRHCMYGQDADLIMLALSTHEPHFTLLREVIDFGRGRTGGDRGSSRVLVKQTRDASFQLLHVSILREYLEFEFLRDVDHVQRDLERIVDDFVFLTFLVGTDFLPHLPSLDISEHAFDRLFEIYGAHYKRWGGAGYLTDRGALNGERLQVGGGVGWGRHG